NAAFGLATVGAFEWIRRAEFGLLYMTDLPVWIELLIAALIFEWIAQHLVPVSLHNNKWMAQFHLVHPRYCHADDTSGTQHERGDFAMREAAALVAVIITGALLAFYFFCRICTVFFTYVTHSNVNMPLWLDKPLSYIFVTPHMHKFHHHYKRPWTDTNYGNIFSVWDRLFGTFVYDDPKKIRYGLDVLDDNKAEDVAYQFKIPFDKTIKTDY